MFAIPAPKYPINLCIVPTCAAPLGQESKDLGFIVCHEHRICPICSLPMQPHEIKIAYDAACASNDGLNNDSLDLKHPRCSIHSPKHSLTDDPTLAVKQSHYDWLNAIRLSILPSDDLSQLTNENNAMIQSTKLISTMDWDEKYMHLKMLEACVANVNLALGQDKKELKRKADAREEKAFAKAKQQASTSSRPVTKAADDSQELHLATFMEMFSLKERSTALKLMRDRDKAIQGFVKIGIAEPIAREMCNKDLAKRGLLTLPKG